MTRTSSINYVPFIVFRVMIVELSGAISTLIRILCHLCNLNSVRIWGIHSLILPLVPRRRGGEWTIGIIDWEPPIEVYRHYKGKSTVEILELYDASIDDEDIKNRYDHENVPIEIASRMNLIPTKIANEGVTEMFGELLDRIDELERAFKTHRHKTFGQGYSEKPAW